MLLTASTVTTIRTDYLNITIQRHLPTSYYQMSYVSNNQRGHINLFALAVTTSCAYCAVGTQYLHDKCEAFAELSQRIPGFDPVSDHI